MHGDDVKQINLEEIEFVRISGEWHHCRNLQIFGNESLLFSSADSADSAIIVDNKFVEAMSVGMPLLMFKG